MLKQPFMNLISEAVATIDLTPRTGEAIIVRNIKIIPNVAIDEFLTVQIDRQTVGFFHVGTEELNQLPYQDQDSTIKTIIEQMKERGYDLSFPVAEGETITFTAPNAWDRLVVDYEIYDAGDVNNEMPNGSRSKVYTFLNYGTNVAAIAAAGYVQLTDRHNPVEFPNFPFGADVPSRTRMSILGIGFPDVTRTGAAFGVDDIYTTFLRLYREREVLFDDARLGIPITGLTLGGAANNTTYYNLGRSLLPYGGEGQFKGIRLFPEPIVFNSGDELAVEIDCLEDGLGGTIQIGDVFCCMPIKVELEQ